MFKLPPSANALVVSVQEGKMEEPDATGVGDGGADSSSPVSSRTGSAEVKMVERDARVRLVVTVAGGGAGDATGARTVAGEATGGDDATVGRRADWERREVDRRRLGDGGAFSFGRSSSSSMSLVGSDAGGASFSMADASTGS